VIGIRRNNIKIYVGCEDLDWILLAEVKVQWWIL
jgi:hypothetical protein